MADDELRDEPATQPSDVLEAGREQRPHLVVLRRGVTQILTLEPNLPRVIGRSNEADLNIEDPQLSRRHLEVRLDHDRVTITDLGSSNGTRLNGMLITCPMPLTPGDVVSIGTTQIAMFRAGRSHAHSVLKFSEVVERIEAEVERAIRYQRPVSLCIINAITGHSEIETTLRASLRAMDVLGRRDGEFLVLLPEVRREHASQVVTRLLSTIDHAFGVRAAVASWPEDGVDAATLLASAQGAVKTAVPGAVATPPESLATIDLGDRVATYADPAMLQLLALLNRLAPTDLPVLIQGETGVGKEAFARGLHVLSHRARQPFIAINCAALPESLAESELFGHARGAFTGADRDRVGKLAACAGGTIFLDEVGELSLAVQAKLLRVFEDGAVIPLGSNRPVPVELRAVAASNRDLKDEVRQGRFRADLFYRLSGALLAIPPLRERPRDLQVLARTLAEEAALRLGRPVPAITPEAFACMARYTWPGNVRELRNAIELAVVTATDALGPDCLPPEIAHAAAVPERHTRRSDVVSVTGELRPLVDQQRELEYAAIARALEAAGGVRKRAAELLGIPLRTLHARLKEYPELADAWPAPTRRP